MSDLSSEPVPCLLCGSAEATTVAVTPPHLAPDRGERFRYVRCLNCRLVRLSPRPEVATLEAYYGSDYLPHRGPEAWGRWASIVRRAQARQDRRRVELALDTWRETADPPVAKTPPAGALRALDVGCGTPTFLAELRSSSGASCTGVDSSDRGWRSRPELRRGLDLRTGSLDQVALDPGFDILTLWHVLEHIPDPMDLLARLRGLAKPDAALVVEVPDHGCIPRRVQGASWIGYDAPRHLAAYEPDTLRKTLERAGWWVVRFRRQGTIDPWVLWWLGRQVGKGRALGGSLSARFPGFVAGKLLTWPLVAMGRGLPLGAMVAVARPTAST